MPVIPPATLNIALDVASEPLWLKSKQTMMDRVQQNLHDRQKPLETS